MYCSHYNVLIDLENYPEYSVLHNLFHGRVALVDRDFAQGLRPFIEQGDESKLTLQQKHSLLDRKFAFASQQQEVELIERLYQNFSDALPATSNPTRQYLILLTYDCNLSCVYCFQKKLRSKSCLDASKLQTIFKIISDLESENDREVNSKKLKTRVPLISIAGGEPLLDLDNHKFILSQIIDFAKKKNFHYAITTNGVNLIKYISLFERKQYSPRDIQVTLDGIKDFHDRRRIRPGGQGSFDAIVSSIEAALCAGIHLSLRINLDSMNVEALNELADLIIERGWHQHENFKAYLAPVTDHSQVNQNYRWLNPESALTHRLLEMFGQRKELEQIFSLKNFRGFSYVQRLVERDGFPVPTFWRCEAVLGQMVFDPNGELYTCFEGSGNKKAKVGEYYPQYQVDDVKQQLWKDLNSVTNSHCQSCKYRFVCASGCPWHIVGQGVTECLPIEDELAIAWNYYSQRIFSRLELN